jgi:thiol-disulfide isomerase/thioredoxin
MIKSISLCLGLFLLLACSENKKKADVLAESSSELRTETVQEIVSVSSIPTYDFSELEKEFLQQNNEQVYVLNFWATWCKPCVKELPAFEQLRSAYKAQNVEVILVSLDFPENLESRVVPFISDHDLKSRVILLDDPDANSWIPKVSEKWSGAIPATLIVKNGVSKFYERSFTFEELENELKTIL